MTDTVSVPETLAGDYALHMHGDAMAPGILNGDLLVVRKLDQQEQAHAGCIVVAKVNGEAAVRTYWPSDPEPGQVRLAADNPTVEDIAAPTPDVLVMGVVVGLVRSL